MIAFYPQFVPADGPVFATTALLGLLQITIETGLYLGLAAEGGAGGSWFVGRASGGGSRRSAARCWSAWASALAASSHRPLSCRAHPGRGPGRPRRPRQAARRRLAGRSSRKRHRPGGQVPRAGGRGAGGLAAFRRCRDAARSCIVRYPARRWRTRPQRFWVRLIVLPSGSVMWATRWPQGCRWTAPGPSRPAPRPRRRRGADVGDTDVEQETHRAAFLHPRGRRRSRVGVADPQPQVEGRLVVGEPDTSVASRSPGRRRGQPVDVAGDEDRRDGAGHGSPRTVGE